MFRCLAPLALAALIAGCAQTGGERSSASENLTVREGPETRPLQGGLAPAAFPLSDELVSIDYAALEGGARGQIRISQTGNTISGTEQDGCSWRKQADWFAPSQSWSNCGTSKSWRTATAEVRVTDPIYPLQLGATGVYQRIARSARGKISERKTKCAVTDAVEVIGASGKAAPSYVVECRDGRRVRKTWYAPGIGPVAYVQRHRKRGLEDAWQRVY